ncbi:phospholipase A2 inhibitor NAI-like [Candoia aspera]|uniref:phospholipase A2 inhibitor NAI-like n=1 Tax=Candoia aspera TaxID=51853 RepID=UPI002FD80B25
MPSLTLCCCIIGTLLYLVYESMSLRCEVCKLSEPDCSGPIQTCYAFLDRCGTFQSSNSRGGKFLTRKACVQSSSCNTNVTILNLGAVGTVSSRLTCCHGLSCLRSLPPFPPLNTTLNGKKCKSCSSTGSTFCFWEEFINCRGEQTYCLEIAGLADWGGFGTLETKDEPISTREFAFKGCVNQAFCEAFHEGSVYFGTLFLMGAGSCKPAPENATAVQSHGSFLLVFAGFLFVEILA